MGEDTPGEGSGLDSSSTSKPLRTDTRGNKKRKASPSPGRGLDFGEPGLANATRLEAVSGNPKFGVRRFRGVSSATQERSNWNKPTSGGELPDKARRARLDATSEQRAEYHRGCYKTHRECLSPFGPKCMCGATNGLAAAGRPGMNKQANTVVNGDLVHNDGTEQAAGGSVGGVEHDTSRIDGGAADTAAKGDGGPVEDGGSTQAAGGSKPVKDSNWFDAVMKQVHAWCAEGGRFDPSKSGDGAAADPFEAGDGAAGAGGAAQDGSGEAGRVSAESLAEDFMRGLTEADERRLAKIVREESSHNPAFIRDFQQSWESLEARVDAPIVNGSESRPAPRVVGRESIWRPERRARLSRRDNAERKKRLHQAACACAEAPLVLSEENKAHLKIIATSIISDMLPALQRLVARDPRIMRWSPNSSKRFKDKIIKKYRADLKAKRKDEIELLKAACKLAKEAVSTKAYRAVRSILVGMGMGWALPTERDLAGARNHMRELAEEDLQLYATPDGWFAALRQVVEHEADRLLQMPAEKATRDESGARSIGHAGPGMLNWQETLWCKITCDARRITKKCSITEFMLHVFRKGAQAAADSQRALAMRTLGMWLGKDSRENVQANATEFFKQCERLQNEGLVFDRELQTFLGRSKAFSELSEEEKLAEEKAAPDQKRYFPVKVRFWFPADMAAQCGVFGHGCAGKRFCAHCMANEDERHLPYTLFTTTKATSLQAMAHEHDMHARTLYAINAGVDHKNVQILTAQGLRESTRLNAEARAQALAPEPDAGAGEGARRPAKKPKAAPRPKDGPDVDVLKKLIGWRTNHPRECTCGQCLIPAGTCVRVMPVVGFSRPSEYLLENFPSLTADRCPFCALHCKMRVTETLFYQICQAALTSKHQARLVDRMNAALAKEKINRVYQKNVTSKTYEKISFEGHQVKRLLEEGPDGKMAIERVLEAMWPNSTEDSDVAKVFKVGFVPRTIEVWRQWAVVEKLMSERFPDKLKKDVIGGEDGFARFGKECREFIFRFQSMSTEDYSKSYYLHTLMDHAGDFMRALEKDGFTLGMMSNSGAERRHEYGRRASRKALASNGWRKKKPEYDKMENLLVYLTLTEVLMWDYGEDLISYTMARLIRNGVVPQPQAMKEHNRPDFQTKSRNAQVKEDQERLLFGKASKPLLSEAEVESEFNAQPDDEPPTFETSNKFWKRTGKKQAYALIAVQPDDAEENELDPDHKHELFSLVLPPCSDDDESDAGSEVDLHDLTINDDFEDDEEDSDFCAAEGAEDRDLAGESFEWVAESSEAEKGHNAHVETGTRAKARELRSRAAAPGSARADPTNQVASGRAHEEVARCAAQIPQGVAAPGSAPAHLVSSGRAEDEGARRAVPLPKRGQGMRRGARRGRGQQGPGFALS